VRNLFSITIICLSFLIIGVFLCLSNNIQHLAGRISRDIAVVVFLEPGLNEDVKQAVREILEESNLVEKLDSVSSAQARERFRARFPDLASIVDNLEVNPFPASLDATLKDDVAASPAVNVLINRLRRLEGVDDVQYNQEWLERLQGFSRLARAIGFFLGGILILASFFIISNVIKLNVLARCDEIDILRMVGTSNAFIRIPFLLEGIVLGFLGGLISLLLLYLLIRALPVYLGSSLGIFNDLINFRYLSFSQAATVMLGGAVTGLVGSASSVSRFLKT
jgi:cell division transport system permease protein